MDVVQPYMRALGMVVLLTTAALTGCIGQDDPASDIDADPPTATARWTAQDCTGVSLVWTPPLATLDPVVGPWTPVEGPVPDRGLFVLFVFECPDSVIDGNATGPVSGGAAIVPIQAPPQTHGIQTDGWAAVPEALGDAAVAGLFAGHGFVVPDGGASVTVEPSPAGWQAHMSYETADGSISASGVVSPEAEPNELDNALVADHAEPFSVFHGPESMERRTGSAVVEASGETWVSRLELEPVPFSYAVDMEFEWDFTFELDAGG